jgi:amino acid adenylation domain-containing protein
MNRRNYPEVLKLAAKQNVKEREFWLEQLSGEIVKTGFPFDINTTTANEFNMDSTAFRFPGIQEKELYSKLLELTKGSNYTLNMVLISTITLLLSKYTGYRDVLVGTPIYKQLIEGDFVNTVLVLRNRIENNITFRQFLLLVRQTIKEANENQNYPLEILMEELTGDTGDNIYPFDTAALLEDIHEKEYLRGVRCNVIFSFVKEEDCIKGVLRYNSALYTKSAVQQIIAHFTNLLRSGLLNIDLPLFQLGMITQEEKNNILYDFNNTTREYPHDKTVLQIFAEQAMRSPDKIAACSPVELNDIFRDSSCFKKNPYIFQCDLEDLNENFKLLKTHHHNSVVVNPNTWKLIEHFNGQQTIASIYSHLKDLTGIKFIIYTVEMGDMLEITQRFSRKPAIFSNAAYDDFILLVKMLYENHLIELAAVRPDKSTGENEKWADFTPGEFFPDKIDLNDLFLQQRNYSHADVLLLGDTPGMPSTGLLYIASYLKRNGVKVLCRFYDRSVDYQSMKTDIEYLLEQIRPRIVAISLKWFLYIARVLDMCKIIKEYSRRHGLNIKVVVGGNTASYYWEETIKYDYIDYLVRGDGEEPLLKIARGEKNIPNCIYKENGKIIENPITYIQDEKNSTGIYLSHLDEILLDKFTPLFGVFYVYTQKGCTMNCLYCGGCNKAQQIAFNRKNILRRRIEETRKDIIEAKKYASAFLFEFDILDKNLAGYCREIWEGIDLSGHFCWFNTLTPPTTELVELVSRTFKYVYWDFDICTPSERHRKQLESLRLVKPQPSDAEIMDFFTKCEQFKNIEVRPNLITGLPLLTSEDIEAGEKLLTEIMSTFTCFGELHWARLHAQPGAPIVQDAAKHNMYSYAATFEDFLDYSKKNVGRDSDYSNIENFDYPYIYFNEDRLNSRITNFYLETNKKVARHTRDKKTGLIVSNTLTYRQLDDEAGQLAGVLKAKGIKPGGIVGLMLEPSSVIPVGILGIFKAGCSYLPIDPEFPVERIKYMLKDTNSAALVTRQDLSEKSNKIISWEGEKILLGPDYSSGRGEVSPSETIPATGNLQSAAADTPSSTLTSTSTCQVSPADLAYVIYTSGTTGKPKGVAIKHENLVNYVYWFSNQASLTGKDKAILTTSFAFDLGYTVLYTPLLKGGELHIVPREIYLDTERLLRYIKQKEITYIKVTPSLFSVIVNSPGFSKITCQSLRFAAMGGEPINVKDIEKAHSICSHLKIMNHYGPTEATIGCAATIIDFTHFEEYKTQPVIGKPIDNTGIYILGKNLELLPVGVPGELCVSGAGVGRGYLNQPELTDEKFRRAVNSHLSLVIAEPEKPLSPLIPNDQCPMTNDGSSRFYRTGDLARWLPDGNIEFLGRIDTQVKIRGYRIEPGEIEKRLKAHPRLEDAVVLVKKSIAKENTPINGDKYLCAYIVPQSEKFAFNTGKENEKKILTSKDILDTIGQREDKTLSILSLFQKQVKANGDKVAVKSGGRILTYDSLDRLARLVAGKIIEEYDDRYKLSEKERIRYKRQMLLHGWGAASQEKLKATTVFVAGAGGGASPTITQLALMGLGTIRVCDYDEVELSNLNRQFLHNEERLGMNKALSAQIYVRKTNPHVNVIPITKKMTRENVDEMVGDSEIIFDMLDGLADKFILSEYAVDRGIPHVIISMADINAYTAVLHTPRTPCYHCIFDKKKLDAIVAGMQSHVKNYSKNPLPVVATSLFISTGIAVNEALKILLGFKNPAYNKFFYFNQRGEEKNLVYTPSYKAMTYLFSDHFLQLCKTQGFDWDIGWRGRYMEEFEITPDPGCPVCGTKREGKKAEKVPVPHEVNLVGKEAKKSPQAVGILLDMGINVAPANIGSLKAGKAPVFLNPSASPERLCHILEDSEVRVILTEGHLLPKAEKLRDTVDKNIKVLDIGLLDQSNQGNENLNIDLNPDPIACIIYPPDSGTPITRFYDVLLQGTGDYNFENTGNQMKPASLSSELTDYLLEVLPVYMIPSHFVKVDKIPLTPNGKVDIKALPEAGAEEKGKELVPPCNETEEKLVDIWAEVLAIEKDIIGTDSNFFELGGHSLNATILIAKIHHEFDYKFPLNKIFETPNIRSISKLIRAAKELSNLEIEFTDQEVMEIEL